MASTRRNNSRRSSLPGKASGVGIDYSRDGSRPDGAPATSAQGADSLPRPAALIGNSELWAKLWVKWGAPPLNTKPWSGMHHIILARLTPFFNEYAAADDKYAVLERYGL